MDLRSRISEIDAEFASFITDGEVPLKRESAADPMADLHYLDRVLLKERRRAESLKSWAWIGFASAFFLLVACLGFWMEAK